MNKIYVLKTWIRLKQASIVAFVMNTIVKMTGNASFPDPAVKLDDLDKSAVRYGKAYGNRRNGANARAELKAAKAELFELLSKQGEYVTGVAQGSETIITSAGFENSKGKSSRAVTPEQPRAPKISYKNGELVVSVPAVKGAKNYLWMVFLGPVFDIKITNQQLEVDATAKFIQIPAGSAREVVLNLGIGTVVNVQVLAQNAAGKSTFSTAVTYTTGG